MKSFLCQLWPSELLFEILCSSVFIPQFYATVLGQLLLKAACSSHTHAEC